MIICEARIYRFGPLNDKIIKFKPDINVIYGENEKGKTTIENFIKIMLYGISKRKGKEERLKYVIDNRTAKGELIVLYNNKKIIIKRTFGASKKEDTSRIYDLETGENLADIDSECPGKDFFGINKSTFEKTLFIGQLAVSFTKDKEEEIMDRITSMFGIDECQVQVSVAMQKLDSEIKKLRTPRKMGLIDLLEKKHQELLEEKYEGIKLSEKNIHWENELLSEKSNRNKLNEEIKKLEIYKKYIKRMNIREEYKEINDYLSKSQNLKNQENKINSLLVRDDNVIDESFISSLKEENNKYSFLRDKIFEIDNSIRTLNNKLNDYECQMEEYSYFNVFDENTDKIKEKLISLKYEIRELKNRLGRSKEIIKNISSDEKEIEEKKQVINNFDKIKEVWTELRAYIDEYDEKLRTLSYMMENNTDDISKGSYNKIFYFEIISSILSVIAFCILIMQKGQTKYISVFFIVIFIALLFLILKRIIENKKNKLSTLKIKGLQEDVGDIEKKLNYYCEILNLSKFEELFILVKNYSAFLEYQNKMMIRINEKKALINMEEHRVLENKLNKLEKVLKSFVDISRCIDIDEILREVDQYELIKSDINSITNNININEVEKKQIKDNIAEVVRSINRKLIIMNIDIKSIDDLDFYIKEYENKIKKRDEIHNNLLAVEKTYKYLLKDRDIDTIREELNKISGINTDFSFANEEEIEKEEKNRSAELLECEKRIKDLENNINNRFLRRRNLIEIEEEIYSVEEQIKNNQKKYNALLMAYKYIGESQNDIRRNIGPRINEEISKFYSQMTEGKYDEVIMNQNYEMIVRNKDSLIEQKYLSNGARDQLYLCLRIALIKLIFKQKNYILLLDDAFVQYDDNRRKNAVIFLASEVNKQILMFTCQKNEENILCNENISFNKIIL